MKAHLFIAPALALVAGIFWVGGQENTLTVLREKTRVVQERLGKVAAARSDADPSRPDAGGAVAETDEFSLPDGSTDWEAIARLMAKAQENGGMPTDMKTMLKLQKRFMEMSEEEIADGMAKIRTLDLDEPIRVQLEAGLFQRLADKNPEKALDLMGDAINGRENPLGWVQRNAYSKFAKDDPAAAMAWLDRQVKEGKLVSKALDPGDNPRLELESALIGKLYASDPAAAKARIEQFDEAERVRLFSNSHEWRRDGKMPAEFLILARESLSEDRATSAIANAWGSQYDAKLSSVSEALKEVSFSDKEREAVIDQSVLNFTRNGEGKNDYDSAYEWAAEQAPGQAGSVIAKALLEGRQGGEPIDGQFERSIQLAEKFDDPSILDEFARRYDPNEDHFQKMKNPALLEKLNALREALPKENN